MNMQDILDEYHIAWIESGNHHCREGWIQLDCPFCNETGKWHMGYSLSYNYFSCWKCGYHSVFDVFSELNIREKVSSVISSGLKKQRRLATKLELPDGAGALKENHKKYLKNRGFDPDYIEKKYGVMGTGFTGMHKFRVVIPFFWEGSMVSYQARDITGKQKAKYLNCRDEVVPTKDILYNFHNCNYGKIVICEGCMDVWKIGDGAVSTCGTQFSQNQINLAKHFNQVFIMFDNEKKAQEQAFALGNALSCFHCKVENICLKEYNDAGDMPEAEALRFRKKIGLDS